MTRQLPSDVIRVGTDSSTRPILMTRYMAAWWARVVEELGWTPVITQGGWMARAGGGAVGSAGYHDGGGCLDLRIRDLTAAQVAQLIRVLRKLGAAAWVRDVAHGGFTDEHVHLVLGRDVGLTPGAAWQWSEYIAGRDGLASRGDDYHPRPIPLVTTPPQEDDMSQYAEQLDRIEKTVVETAKQVAVQERARTKTLARDRALAKQLRETRAALAKGQRAGTDKVLDAIADALDEDA